MNHRLTMSDSFMHFMFPTVMESYDTRHNLMLRDPISFNMVNWHESGSHGNETQNKTVSTYFIFHLSNIHKSMKAKYIFSFESKNTSWSQRGYL